MTANKRYWIFVTSFGHVCNLFSFVSDHVYKYVSKEYKVVFSFISYSEWLKLYNAPL